MSNISMKQINLINKLKNNLRKPIRDVSISLYGNGLTLKNMMDNIDNINKKEASYIIKGLLLCELHSPKSKIMEGASYL